MVGMAFWEVGPYSWTLTKEQWKVEMSGPDFLRVRQGTSKDYGSWARLAPFPSVPCFTVYLAVHSLLTTPSSLIGLFINRCPTSLRPLYPFHSGTDVCAGLVTL